MEEATGGMIWSGYAMKGWWKTTPSCDIEVDEDGRLTIVAVSMAFSLFFKDEGLVCGRKKKRY